MNITPKVFRRAVYPILCLSLPGLVVVCSLLLGWRAVLHLTAAYQVQIVLGYAAMVLLIETLGIALRWELCGYGTGGVFGVLLFITGVVGGSASSMLVFGNFDVRYVIGPLFWMGFYGVLPAAIFGLIGTGVLRMTGKEAPPTKLHLKRP